MAEIKEITKLYVVTDSETSYDKIGDIDGGMFDEEWLENHIKSHGSYGLIKRFAYMNRQVLNMEIKINNDKENSQNVTVAIPNNLKVNF